MHDKVYPPNADKFLTMRPENISNHRNNKKKTQLKW